MISFVDVRSRLLVDEGQVERGVSPDVGDVSTDVHPGSEGPCPRLTNRVVSFRLY